MNRPLQGQAEPRAREPEHGRGLCLLVLRSGCRGIGFTAHASALVLNGSMRSVRPSVFFLSGESAQQPDHLVGGGARVTRFIGRFAVESVDVNQLDEVFADSRLIAACRPDSLAAAVTSPAAAVLLLHVTISGLVRPDFKDMAERKPVYLHADLIKGLSSDREAVLFLRDFVRPAGIVSTRGTVIRAARKEGLTSIQRVFLIDSASLRQSIESIKENQPDAVELMPGIATEAVTRIREEVSVPIIAAGLVRTREQVRAALQAGAQAVSTSEPSLWPLGFPAAT